MYNYIHVYDTSNFEPHTVSNIPPPDQPRCHVFLIQGLEEAAAVANEGKAGRPERATSHGSVTDSSKPHTVFTTFPVGEEDWHLPFYASW